MSNLLHLREYNACTFWLESLKTKSTLTAYTTHLSLFCKFHNTDPDQLIQLSNSAVQLKTMILNYIIQQEDPTKKLEKYAELRQKGLLTEEEFQKLKRGLLSQIAS